jgi:hypothetical protein
MLVKDGLTASWEPYLLDRSQQWGNLQRPAVHMIRLLLIVFHMLMAIFEKPAIP